MADLTLQQISDHTYLIPAPANIGIYIDQGKAILIDSGNDKEAGRQIYKLLLSRGWELKLIINTHSNADHIGGNAFLQGKTSCPIAATPLEAAFINHPQLEPAFLFGGFPFPALKNKFLMAQPSHVTDLIAGPGPILDTGLTAVALPGHYFEMIGIKTPDGVFFIADSVFPEAILDKYHLVFLYDIHRQFETLRLLETTEAVCFVPGHGRPTDHIGPLVESNRRKMEEIIAFLLTATAEPRIFEEILALVCAHFNIALNADQYVLAGSTIKSYLSYLLNIGKVKTNFAAGKLSWQRVDRN